MTKKELRRLYLNKRKTLTPQEITGYEILMLENFKTLNLFNIENCLSFFPIKNKNEPNTFLFLDNILKLNPSCKIYYPFIDNSVHEIFACEKTIETVFKKSSWEIFEPYPQIIVENMQLDMVFVPLVIFDKYGYRIGYGKGYYDKFLAKHIHIKYKIGLSYFEPIEKIDNIENFDIPLTHCITPFKIYEF